MKFVCCFSLQTQCETNELFCLGTGWNPRCWREPPVRAEMLMSARFPSPAEMCRGLLLWLLFYHRIHENGSSGAGTAAAQRHPQFNVLQRLHLLVQVDLHRYFVQMTIRSMQIGIQEKIFVKWKRVLVHVNK